jgi:hypothetical protein|tara:strand:+ start:1452 stop:2339 length:888 start_codon:yes stop_codon:yes gene_type:complete
MKTFKTYLKEFAIKSTSDYVFEVGSQALGSSALKIPISGPMFKRIWPDTIRTTVFHVLSAEDIYDLKKLEGKKKSISAFFSMMAKQFEGGIAAGGGVVAELDADVLVSARDDIMSEVDKTGRRWVMMSWFENQTRERGKFSKVEKDLNVLIKGLVVKHLGPIMGQTEVRRAQEFDLWKNMKRHLKDSKKLSLVIKDYFDGVERVIKANKEVMSSIFYGYAKSKRQTDNAWDEQIVNNIKIKKLHYLPKEEEVEDEEQQENIDAFVAKYKIPAKAWSYSSELEIYTREVVAKEIGR